MKNKQQKPTLRDPELEGGYYVLSSSNFLRSPRYSSNAKIVYALLLTYAGKNEIAWPGQELISSQLGLSKKLIRAALKELAEAGLISIRRQGLGKPNCYAIYKFTFIGAEKEQECNEGNIQKGRMGTSERVVREQELDSIELDSKEIDSYKSESSFSSNRKSATGRTAPRRAEQEKVILNHQSQSASRELDCAGDVGLAVNILSQSITRVSVPEEEEPGRIDIEKEVNDYLQGLYTSGELEFEDPGIEKALLILSPTSWEVAVSDDIPPGLGYETDEDVYHDLGSYEMSFGLEGDADDVPPGLEYDETPFGLEGNTENDYEVPPGLEDDDDDIPPGLEYDEMPPGLREEDYIAMARSRRTSRTVEDNVFPEAIASGTDLKNKKDKDFEAVPQGSASDSRRIETVSDEVNIPERGSMNDLEFYRTLVQLSTSSQATGKKLVAISSTGKKIEITDIIIFSKLIKTLFGKQWTVNQALLNAMLNSNGLECLVIAAFKARDKEIKTNPLRYISAIAKNLQIEGKETFIAQGFTPKSKVTITSYSFIQDLDEEELMKLPPCKALDIWWFELSCILDKLKLLENVSPEKIAKFERVTAYWLAVLQSEKAKKIAS
jgi:hypothetical protein